MSDHLRLYKPKQAGARRTPCWLGFACNKQLRTRLELSGVPCQENPSHPAQPSTVGTPCKPRLTPHTGHIPTVCSCVVAGRETVDASETLHGETTQRRGEEGTTFSQARRCSWVQAVAPRRSVSSPYRGDAHSWITVPCSPHKC